MYGAPSALPRQTVILSLSSHIFIFSIARGLALLSRKFTALPEPRATSVGPRGSLVMDGAGNLCGTTFCDGAHAAGSVFEADTLRQQLDVHLAARLNGRNDGANPISNVVFDANGNIYGTALNGGQGVGVVWEITP